MLIHMLSLSPMGEFLDQESLSWHWAVLPLGRDDAGKEKLFLLPSSMHSTLDFLVCLSNSMLECLC